jgi:RNA polymerase primary sigma factor
MVSKASESTETTEAREETSDSPLMDSTSAAFKKMLQRAKERGYVTYDELNQFLPPEQMSSEQIEDSLSALSEMGITVIESEEQEETNNAASEEAEESTARPGGNRCACTCARWARSSCCRARARSRSPSVSRPAARR